MVAVSKIAAKPFVTSKEISESHIIEHPAGHMTMKRLILNDTERIKTGNKGILVYITLDVWEYNQFNSNKWIAKTRMVAENTFDNDFNEIYWKKFLSI